MYPGEKSKVYAFHIRVPSTVLGRRVSSVVQLFNALSPAFSVEEHLTFEGKDRSLPLDSEEHHEVDHTNLHNFFRSFGPMCSLLWLAIHLSKDGHSQSLRPDVGEFPVDPLPELKELKCSVSSIADGVFTLFENARQNAGRPVTLTVICVSFCDSRELLLCMSGAAPSCSS
jgi:hypothetical protein